MGWSGCRLKHHGVGAQHHWAGKELDDPLLARAAFAMKVAALDD